MRVENNQINPTQHSNSVTTSTTTQKQNFKIGKLLVSGASKTANKSISGKNANINIEQQTNSVMIGFNSQKLNITTADGENFTIDLHISNSCINDNAELTERLSKVLSNLPPNVLKDIKEECKHIVIPQNIIYNKEAKGLAIGPLNQIFLSADKLKEMTNQEISETFVHEIGHLIDEHSSSFTKGKATNSYTRKFNTLKEFMTEDLGFDRNAHTFKGTNEFFADYYLYNNLEVSNKHRSKAIFDLLTTYRNDVETLSYEELSAKYPDKADNIIELNKNWKSLEKDFKYYFENLEDPEIVYRMNENAHPMSFEQLDEKFNQQNKNNI